MVAAVAAEWEYLDTTTSTPAHAPTHAHLCERARAQRARTHVVVAPRAGCEGGERWAREKREMAGKESSNSTKLRHYAAFVLTPLLLPLLLLGG